MKKRERRLVSLLLALCMTLTLLPVSAFAEETEAPPETETAGYKLTYVYPESLCELSAYDWYDANKTPIENGGILPINAEANQAYGVFEAKNIAAGYRIKSFKMTNSKTQVLTDGFINGAYGGIAMTITEDTTVTLELEPIPAELPTVTSVTIYTDQAGTQLAQEYTNYTADDTSARLYGVATYSDGMAYPVYYSTGQWEYSTDGVTWLKTERWGSNRYDFWPGWKYHEELNFLTDSYDIRLCAQPRDKYTTGENVYSNVIHVNGGASGSADPSDPSDLTQLATPTELSWGRYYDRKAETYSEIPGVISWKRETPTQNRYEIVIYSYETGEEVSNVRHRFSADSTPAYFSTYQFVEGYWYYDFETTVDRNFDTGTYYFTIQALGDGTQYSNSKIAQSPTWSYVKPDSSLNTPTGLRWSGRDSQWNQPGDIADVLGYMVEYYWYDAEQDNYISVGGSTYVEPTVTEDSMMDYCVEENGAGQYYFRVRAISRDITKICNSPWSELSPAYNLTDVSGDVNHTLESILDGYEGHTPDNMSDAQKAELKEQLWDQIDTKSLDASMAADRDNSDTVSKIADLETLVGGPAGVSVSENAPKGLNQEDISIIGANLNTAGAAAATLNVSAPTQGVTIPELYDSTVQFSMKLENVSETEQGQQLKVPVKITMPVPSGIDPDFLVLLHFHSDGTYEEVLFPHVFKVGDRTFVSFVVTSFSDFAFAQRNFGIASFDLEKNTVTATVASKTAGTLVAAVYENGQMTGVATAPAVADGQKRNVDLSLPTLAKGSEVKLFLIDSNGKPLYEAASQTIP